MKNKLLTLCTFLFVFVCVVKGQSYKQLTSETIIYTTSVENISDVTWMGGKAGTTVAKDFKTNQSYVAQDDVIASAKSSMLTVKPATNDRFISFYVTGISKVYAYGIAGKSTYGISIEAVASDGTATQEMVSVTGDEGASVMVTYPTSESLDPSKSYIVSVRGVNSDSYLYAVRFAVPSGPSTDNTLHSLTVNDESVTISDAMMLSIPYTYAETTVPVAFEADAAAKVAINGTEATSPATVAAPGSESGASVDHTITVTAEDGTSIKSYTLTITRATVSSVPTLGEVTVGGETITFAEGSTSYTYPTLPYSTTEFPTVAATASNGSTISSIVQATIDNPVATIHVLAEDGNTPASYTVNFSIAAPVTAEIRNEEIVKEWDLTQWSEETLTALAAAESGWLINGGIRYQNSAAYEAGNLKAGSIVISELSGLSFPGETTANKTSIRFDGSSLGLQLGGARVVTLDEALVKGQTVKVILSSPNTTSERGIASVTNLSGACGEGTYGISHVEYSFIVLSDGIVKFESSNGVILEKIEVWDLTSQSLTAEALSTLTSVQLSGDITTADIALLNAADLTSIDLTKTLSVAGGLSPKNPNCLVYANAALAGVKNVVVGDKAATIELTDGNDFHTTKVFTADAIKYTRYLYSGWNTIAFPFPYTVNGQQIEEYSSADANTVVFTEVSGQLNSNQAYLINAGADGEQTFEASGVTVPVTETTGTVFKSNFSAFKMTADNNLYKLNADGTAFNHSDGEALIGAFRGYLDLSSLPSGPSAAPRRIIHGDDGATALTESASVAEEMNVYVVDGKLTIHAACARRIPIYGVDGRTVRVVELEEGENAIDSLPNGIYLVGNRKVVL